MATTQIPTPDYTILGQVVDRATQRGVRGARVEAWDRDTRFHDLLGQVVTDDDGRFAIGYGSVFFGDFQPDVAPDLYFKVQLDGNEVLNTFDRTMMNVPRGRTNVKLEIELPQLRPLGTDIVNVEQSIRAVDWWRASDFKGLWRESGGKAATVGNALGPRVADKFRRWDFEPVGPGKTAENTIVRQPVAQAQQALAAQQVVVTEVREADTSTRGTLRSLARTPLAVQPGDRVTLYTENGVVKYYARSPALAPAGVDAQAVVRLDEEVQTLKAATREIDNVRGEVSVLKQARTSTDERAVEDAAARAVQAEQLTALRGELSTLRQRTAEKDVEIERLRADLGAVRQSQDTLAERLPLRRLEELEARMATLTRLSPAPGPVLGPVPGPSPAPAPAPRTGRVATAGAAAAAPPVPAQNAGKAAKPAKPTKAAKPGADASPAQPKAAPPAPAPAGGKAGRGKKA